MTGARGPGRVLLLATAPTLNVVRKQGIVGFLNGIAILPLLGMLIVGGLYQTLDGTRFDVDEFSSFYPYFVAFSAFAAGAASWETELLSAISPVFAGRPGAALLSRTAYVLVCTAPVAATFAVLRAVTSPGTVAADLACIVMVSAGSAVLGSGAASRGGFRNDKGVNNIVQLTPWVFALGRSPFLPDGLGYVAWLFPGTPGTTSLPAEAVRSAVYLAVGLALVRASTGRRRTPPFVP